MKSQFPAMTMDDTWPFDRIREFYLYQEPALLAAIKRGDRREARRIINHLLVHIYSAGEERNELLKGLLLELVVMISRAAVEAGASQTELLGMRFSHLAELAEMRDMLPLTLTLSPQAGRGNTPSPAWAGEGWGEGGQPLCSSQH